MEAVKTREMNYSGEYESIGGRVARIGAIGFFGCENRACNKI